MDNQIVGQLTWNGSSVKECLHYIVYRQKFPPEKRGDAIIIVFATNTFL